MKKYIFIIISVFLNSCEINESTHEIEGFSDEFIFFCWFMVALIIILTIHTAKQEKRKKEEAKKRKEEALAEAIVNMQAKLDRINTKHENDDELFTNLAGPNYRSSYAQGLSYGISQGEELELKRNPSNEYDENAVKVFYLRTFIGFIPEIDSYEVSELIKKKIITGVYVAKNSSEHGYIDVDIVIYSKKVEET